MYHLAMSWIEQFWKLHPAQSNDWLADRFSRQQLLVSRIHHKEVAVSPDSFNQE